MAKSTCHVQSVESQRVRGMLTRHLDPKCLERLMLLSETRELMEDVGTRNSGRMPTVSPADSTRATLDCQGTEQQIACNRLVASRD